MRRAAREQRLYFAPARPAPVLLPAMLKIPGLLLLVCAYVLLVPGLTEPMLSVSGTVEKAELVEIGREMLKESDSLPGFLADLADRVVDGIDARGTVSAFDKTRSIVETAAELRANGHLPVALLIVLFSVVVPLFKALVLIAALLPVAVGWRRRLAAVANASGKWSMADVFVIAIFVAFLAGNGIQESRGLVDFEASLGEGFWYFLAYCLLSVLGTQLLVAALRRELDTADPASTPAAPDPAPSGAPAVASTAGRATGPAALRVAPHASSTAASPDLPPPGTGDRPDGPDGGGA
mgnify:CR=1 FL=1